MTLCFAAFIRVLRICAKPQVYNKTLCTAVVKTVDEYTIIGTDDGQISHLMSCDYNLSPKDVIQPVRNTDLSKISQGMQAFLLPLLKAEMIPQAAKTRAGVAGVMAGYTLMMALDLALG